MKIKNTSKKKALKKEKKFKPIMPRPVLVTRILTNEELPFNETANKSELTAISKFLNLKNISYLNFQGKIVRIDSIKFYLSGFLKAKIIQNCIITLDPIKSNVLVQIERFFVNGRQKWNPVDISIKANAEEYDLFQNELDLGTIALEELSVELPDYPRKSNTHFSGISVTEKGISKLNDSNLKPFAALSVLKKKNSQN